MDSDLRHIREIETVSQGGPAARDSAVVQSWLRCRCRRSSAAGRI